MLFGDAFRGGGFENPNTRFGTLKMLQQYMWHSHEAVSFVDVREASFLRVGYIHTTDWACSCFLEPFFATLLVKNVLAFDCNN